MKILLQWIGVLVICLWLGTMLVGLTMMWDREWMDRDITPTSQWLTNAVHMFAVYLGVCLGPALLFKAIRNKLGLFHKVSYIIGFLLALFSAWLMTRS